MFTDLTIIQLLTKLWDGNQTEKMAETAGELKVKRRTAKGKLTRGMNQLQALLNTERSIKEVDESYHEFRKLYENVEAKHDAYCEVLDDDAYEQAWMAECMNSFMQMKLKVMDYVGNSTGVDDSTREVESPRSEVRNTTACQVQIEKPTLPRFSGDISEYQTFKSDFKHLIESRYGRGTVLPFCVLV